jgi:thiamine-phosphate pyrophosphorylase
VDPSWIIASKLWLVLDRGAAAPRNLLAVTAQALDGGVDAVMCRVKDATPSELRAIAGPLRELCRQRQAPFVISHNVELALELGADGVHLGAGAAPLASVRAITGPRMRLGYSTHSVPEARSIMEQGADYVFLGPVFPTPAKLKYGPPLGLDVVAPALELPMPVAFIGGINHSTLPELVARGASRIAVIAALQRVPDVTAAARELRRMLDPR